MGRLTEITALLELKRRKTGVTEINYWKGKSGAETDFVIRRGKTVEEAIKVTWDLSNPKTYSRETRGLARCATEVKAEKATILTNGPPEEIRINGVTITVKPIIGWLKEPQPKGRDKSS